MLALMLREMGVWISVKRKEITRNMKRLKIMVLIRSEKKSTLLVFFFLNRVKRRCIVAASRIRLRSPAFK